MDKKALFYKKEGSILHCSLCPKNCKIAKDRSGFCKVRKNTRSVLHSINYGRLTAVNVDPIEKKPFYHFKPGTFALSVGTFGCNFTCPYCCNWNISQAIEDNVYYISPEVLVNRTTDAGVPSIAYTYNEPTIFYEYAYDTSKIASSKKLNNLFVTNGYIQKEPIKKISEYLDAAVINLKGFSEKFYKSYCNAELEPVLKAIKEYKKNNVWIEISNLVIPKKNDEASDMKELCEWVVDNVGDKVPFHIIGFFPSYKMSCEPSAPESAVMNLRKIAVKSGMNYVYSRTKGGLDTVCPKCKTVLIQRSLYNFCPTSNRLEADGFCYKCGQKLDFIL